MTIELGWDAFSRPARPAGPASYQWIDHQDMILIEEIPRAPHHGRAVEFCLKRDVLGPNASDWFKAIRVLNYSGVELSTIELAGRGQYGPECTPLIDSNAMRDGKLIFAKARGFGVNIDMYHLFLGDILSRRSPDNNTLVASYRFTWKYDSRFVMPGAADWYPSEIRQNYGVPIRANLLARHSGKALDVWAGWQHDGVRVFQWDRHDGPNQIWRLTPLASGHYQLLAEHSGKALDVSGGDLSNGAVVHQWGPHGWPNQQWDVVAVDTGFYKVMARHSGKVLDVAGSSTDNGATVHQWDWHGGHNQQWKLFRR